MTVTEKSVGHDSRPLSPPIPKANPMPLWGATGVYPSPFLAVSTNRWLTTTVAHRIPRGRTTVQDGGTSTKGSTPPRGRPPARPPRLLLRPSEIPPE